MCKWEEMTVGVAVVVVVVVVVVVARRKVEDTRDGGSNAELDPPKRTA